MSSFATILGHARDHLQDKTVPYRYSDPELMVGANDAVRIIRKVRPDLFLGGYKIPLRVYTTTDEAPVALEYEMLIRDYVVGHVQLRETEDAEKMQAGMFLNKFEKALMAL
jgi:hypothetical protein